LADAVLCAKKCKMLSVKYDGKRKIIKYNAITI
jgi:hypothetical protein